MQALAFDFDGLILDTETPEFEVWQDEFRIHGIEMPAGYWTDVIGRGAEQNIERPPQLLERLVSGYRDTPERQASRKARILDRISREQVRPGILALLDEAAGTALPIGVASSSKHDWVDTYLRKLGLFERFQTTVCADDVVHAKPFPDLYLELCRRLGSDPSETVALEDSPNGVAAAKAAGLFAVAVPNSVTILLDLSRADLQIDDLSQWTLEKLKQASSRFSLT